MGHRHQTGMNGPKAQRSPRQNSINALKKTAPIDVFLVVGRKRLKINNNPNTDKTGYTLRFPALHMWARNTCWSEDPSSKSITRISKTWMSVPRDLSQCIAGWHFPLAAAEPLGSKSFLKHQEADSRHWDLCSCGSHTHTQRRSPSSCLCYLFTV